MRTTSFTVNGRPCTTPAGTLLADFLAGQGVDPAAVAVERNREILPRAEHARTVISDGDAFEVVQLVGGG